jgi:hypothetical protein
MVSVDKAPNSRIWNEIKYDVLIFQILALHARLSVVQISAHYKSGVVGRWVAALKMGNAALHLLSGCSVGMLSYGSHSHC